MSIEPKRSIVTIRDANDNAVGVGFAISKVNVITCAHVINTALRRDERAPEVPNEELTIKLEFPLLDDEHPPVRNAHVIGWRAPPSQGGPTVLFPDVAVLKLHEPIPASAQIAEVRSATEPAEVWMFGYPEDIPVSHGVLVSCELVGGVDGGKIQIQSKSTDAVRAQAGYSGSPVVERETGRVLGMFAEASRHPDGRLGFAIPPEWLRAAWPDLQEPPIAHTVAGPRPVRGTKAGGVEAVLVLAAVAFAGLAVWMIVSFVDWITGSADPSSSPSQSRDAQSSGPGPTPATAPSAPTAPTTAAEPLPWPGHPDGITLLTGTTNDLNNSEAIDLDKNQYDYVYTHKPDFDVMGTPDGLGAVNGPGFALWQGQRLPTLRNCLELPKSSYGAVIDMSGVKTRPTYCVQSDQGRYGYIRLGPASTRYDETIWSLTLNYLLWKKPGD